MNDEFTIRQVIRLPEDFQELYRIGTGEGHRFLTRLKDDWESGANRFDALGEAFFEARRNGVLVGVCGLNRDPHALGRSAGRLRRMYVLPEVRRKGVGRLLVAKALQHALDDFEIVRLRTYSSDADKFYRSLGFQPIEGEDQATHELRLPRR